MRAEVWAALCLVLGLALLIYWLSTRRRLRHVLEMLEMETETARRRAVDAVDDAPTAAAVYMEMDSLMRRMKNDLM